MCVRLYFLIFLAAILASTAKADVVKPALVEISASTRGEVSIEVRASIEALLTGINAQYKNTQDAPTAEEYDALRVLESRQLHTAFEPFKQQFIGQVSLTADNAAVPLQIVDVWIPEPGYTKVPRISVITLSGEISPNSRQLQWYYPARFGDNAVRVRQVDEANQQWHWSEWQWLRDDKPSQPFSLEEIFTRTPTQMDWKTTITFTCIIRIQLQRKISIPRSGRFPLSTKVCASHARLLG